LEIGKKRIFALAGRGLTSQPAREAARPSQPRARPRDAGGPARVRSASSFPSRSPRASCPPRQNAPAAWRTHAGDAPRGHREPRARVQLQNGRALGLPPISASLAPSLPPSSAIHRGTPLATAHHRHLRLVPASVDRLRSIACARSSATSSSPPNGPSFALFAYGTAQSSFPRRATASVPPGLRSAHRLPRSLSIPLTLSLGFATSSRTPCAGSLVGSWPEMAVGRRPSPRRRGQGRRRGRPVLSHPQPPLGHRPLGRASEWAGSPFRPRARAGRERPRAGCFPRAGPISLTKNHFLFSINIHDEKHFGKCFLGHFSSKNGEINFYVLFGTRSMI
jgi:hypothetical protein